MLEIENKRRLNNLRRSDIERLEDILINQDKYKNLLVLRQIELEHRDEEPEGKVINPDAQDQRTIKSRSKSSPVETVVLNLHKDLKYQSLYAIVTNTPKFITSLNPYEKVIYNYRYRQVDLSVYEWEDIAMKLTDIACKEGKSFSKSTTLRLRNSMLNRLADMIEYVRM